MNNKSNFGPEGCKLFVGGLSWNTTREMLYEEFSKYGELIDYVVMKNPETGQSRGFGFITFQDQAAAENALNSGGHRVDGRNVDLKHCNPKNNQSKMMNSGGMSYSNSMIMPSGMNSGPPGGNMTGSTSKPKNENCKVFVGGLPNGVGEEEIKQFFSRYGPVREFKLHMDELKQKPKGYGFLTFEFEESANQVLQEHYIQLNGKQVEIRPQANNIKQQLNFAQQHHQSQPQQAAVSGQFQQYGNIPHAASNNWNQPQMPPAMNWNSPVVPPAPSGPTAPTSAPVPAAVPWPANTNAPVGYPNQLWGYPPLNGMPPAPTSMPPQMYPSAPNPASYGYYSGFYDPASYESMDKMASSGPGYPYDPSMLPGGQVMPDNGLDEASGGLGSSDGGILQPNMQNMQHYRGSSHGSSSTSSKAPSLSSIQTSSSNMSSSGVSKSSSDLSDVSHQNHHMGRYSGRNGSRGPSSGSRMMNERGNSSAGGRRSGGGSMANTSMSSESSYSSRSKNGGGSSTSGSASGNHQFRQSSSYHPYRR